MHSWRPPSGYFFLMCCYCCYSVLSWCSSVPVGVSAGVTGPSDDLLDSDGQISASSSSSSSPSSTSTSSSLSCPARCFCPGTSVDCSRAQLMTLPSGIPSNAVILDLSQNNLSSLADRSFVDYRNLEELNLASNNLYNVSIDVFEGLAKLRVLNLNKNNFTLVPWRALLELQYLQELNLGDNNIRFVFGEDFRGLPELKVLILTGNWLEFVPVEALQDLNNLEVLSVANNNLSRIGDESFQNLTQLQALSLAGNQITTISLNAFLGLLSLEILELQRNFLVTIPNAIQNLPSLRKLSVAFNHIRYVADTTFGHNPNLAHVDLLGNPIAFVGHRTFANLSHLKILIIPEAKELSVFPDLNGTASMEFLRIDRAHLSHVPDNLCLVSRNLKTLDLKSNNLAKVPELSSCTELRQLQLSGNRITSLKGALFRQQGFLHDLLLSDNQIEIISEDAFLGLHKLEILNLMGNRISDINHDAFLPLKQLVYLNMAENQFTQLPDQGLEHVRQLMLFNNPRLRDFPPPTSFPHVQTLRLAYAYHCCQFMSPSIGDQKEADQTLGIQGVPSGLKETVYWVPKDEVDMSLWNSNTTDLWPIYYNLTHKFGDVGEDVWGSLPPDYVYPSNLPQVIEDYAEESRGEDSDERRVVRRVVSCSPQPGPFMPCEDLFDWWTLRCGIWIVFLLAMLGNGTVVFVLVFSRTKLDVPRFLVCHLACADFFMGIYLGFLAVVDASTLGHFKRHALQWQFSVGCQLAGFLGVLSSELSVYTLAVITLERHYAITHAMHLNKRLSLRHAAYVMACGWAFALVTAALPFVGISDYRRFAVCLPFDIDAPWSLAYVVFLMAANGVAFLILMGCYLKMYCAIRGSQAWNSNDSRIAKRMALLVFTDFVCWAPIAFFSLTAAFGLQLVTLEEAKVFTIFVLPLNSCANPFLYAILTKQFKKDCVLICKAIEESRVTRGIGRCRHSSNFSNRQTPADVNSAVERQSNNGAIPGTAICSCGSSSSVLTSGPRSWKWPRLLVCARGSAGSVDDSSIRSAPGGGKGGMPIPRSQPRRGGASSGRRGSVSSENFSSSRSDSWRHQRGSGSGVALRALEKGWSVARKSSQDSNLSSSRNDSSTTTPSTSTWRVSRSSVSSSDMSAHRVGTAAASRDRVPAGEPVTPVVRFSLPPDAEPAPPPTSARPRGKLRRQAAVTDDSGSPEGCVLLGRLLQVAELTSSAEGDVGFVARKLSTISSNSCSLNQESWSMVALDTKGQESTPDKEIVAGRNSWCPSERCQSLNSVMKDEPGDARRTVSDIGLQMVNPEKESLSPQNCSGKISLSQSDCILSRVKCRRDLRQRDSGSKNLLADLKQFRSKEMETVPLVIARDSTDRPRYLEDDV